MARSPGRKLPCVLGAYELFDHIGRGGMADIYRATQRTQSGSTRSVVIKEVLPELAGKERMLELLAEEAKLASQLDHPNVVRVEQLEQDDDTLYIAMEWVEGLDLREFLRRCAREGKSLPLDLSLFIVSCVLAALDYAHRADMVSSAGEKRVGLIHRDVSPSNVLLSLEGEVKLCDFGIAKAHDELNKGDADASLVEGKAGYMSPEQACGFGLDGRADVFAAGIVLWELCSGRRFHKRKGDESLIQLAQGGAPKPLGTDGYPDQPSLQALLDQALASDREARFETAGDMRQAVESYAAANDLVASSRTLRKFIEEHFADELQRAQRRRELATEALGRGPVAVVQVLDVPVIGMVPEPESENAAVVAPAQAPGASPARVAFGKIAFGAVMLLMLVYLVGRAFSTSN